MPGLWWHQKGAINLGQRAGACSQQPSVGQEERGLGRLGQGHGASASVCRTPGLPAMTISKRGRLRQPLERRIQHDRRIGHLAHCQSVYRVVPATPVVATEIRCRLALR